MQFGFELSGLCLEEKGSPTAPAARRSEGWNPLWHRCSPLGYQLPSSTWSRARLDSPFLFVLKTEGCADTWNLKIKHMWQFLWQRTGLCNPQRLFLWWLDRERWISSLSHLYWNNSSADKNPTQFLSAISSVCFSIFSVTSNTTEYTPIITMQNE